MTQHINSGRRLGSCVLAWCLSALLAGSSMLLLLPGVQARDRLLYWNMSNPVFQTNRVNVYLVPKNDRLVIICPTNGLEFYSLYWTHSSEAATACDSRHSQVFQLLHCNNPGDFGAFLVSDFSPIPGAPTFERTVHIFTPSDGSKVGISQEKGGACEIRNMRLNVDIGNPDLLTQPAVQPTTSGPGATSSATRKTTTKSTATSTSETSAEVPRSGSTQAGTGGGHGTGPPTAQDPARRALANIIVGAKANRASVALHSLATALGMFLIWQAQ